MRPCLSPLGEEISQDGLTLAFQHAAVHFRTMADMRIARNIPNRTACTELGIPGTERDGADMGLDAGTRAHRARLKCDGQRAIGEIPSAQGLGRLTHGDDFGVGKRVAISLTRVVSAPDNLAGRIQHHRTNIARVQQELQDQQTRSGGIAGQIAAEQEKIAANDQELSEAEQALAQAQTQADALSGEAAAAGQLNVFFMVPIYFWWRKI